MKNFLTALLNPPVFPDDENKTRAARYGHWIALVFMGIILIYEIVGKIITRILTFNVLDLILVGLFIILFISFRLIRNGWVGRANTLLVTLLWIGVNIVASLGFGVRDSAYIANFIVILAAGLLLGWPGAIILASATIIIGIGLAYAETNNLLPTAYYIVSPSSVIVDMSAIYTLYAIFLFMLISGLDTALKNAQSGKSKLEAANRELYESQNHLEENRNELLVINEQLKRRTERINSIAEISKTVTSIQEIRLLLSSVVNTISYRFGYYHVAIYLIDEQKQFAVLRASNSAGGLSMIEKNHRLRVGEQSVIGIVAHSGQSHIVREAATDRLFFNDPKLPDSVSEMALPLKSGDELIGVLDIQSPETNAFSEDDVSTLPILADQVAIAIQNAFLFERTQRLLRETEAASKQTSRQEWTTYEKGLQTIGYRYDGIKSEALREVELLPAQNKLLNIPVRLRGQTIGSLKLKPVDSSHVWTDDELAIIEATSDRVALALEGSRLLDDAQKRATREAFLSDVAARLSTSFQLDSILRDTVEELGKNLKGSTVSFQLVSPSKTPLAESQKSNGTPANEKNVE